MPENGKVVIAVNRKQEIFCEEFVKSGNAAEAYKLAGYKVSSAKSAANSASRLLENVGICSRIAELREKAADAQILDAKQRRIILSDIAKAKGQDAVRALDVLNKMDGLYINKVEVSGEIGIVDALKRARERLQNAKE